MEKTGGRRRKMAQWRGGLQNQHMRKPSRDKWRDWEETGKGGNQPDMGKLGLAGEAGTVRTLGTVCGIAGGDKAMLGTGGLALENRSTFDFCRDSTSGKNSSKEMRSAEDSD